MNYLVLSLFPGIDLFGRAFEEEGFCVVRGPDIIYGQDVRTWSAMKGKFDVLIGGPPCKVHSSVGRWGPTPSQENMIPEFERLVEEAQPLVFVMENVKEAPKPHVENYAIMSYVIDSWQYGADQQRKRRFTFGYRNQRELSSFPFIPEEPLPKNLRRENPFPTILASEGKFPTDCAGRRKLGRRLTLAEVCELQGFPDLANAWCFTPRGVSKRKVYRKEFEYELIGNGVERKAGLVIARAVKAGLEYLEATLTRPDIVQGSPSQRDPDSIVGGDKKK